MNYDFVQNTACEYFPCHPGVELGRFNCLFCYCPLYALGRNCGGSFSYDNAGCVKDCSGCVLPHLRENYPYILQRLSELIETVADAEKARRETEAP